MKSSQFTKNSSNASADRRDRAGLEAALARPQTGYYKDLIEEGAALWESLSRNPPLIDGNKRISITTAVSFLRMNEAEIAVDDHETYAFVIGLHDTGQFWFEALEQWLREHVK